MSVDALQFLASAPHPDLGLPNVLDLEQRPPIYLRSMTRDHLALLFAELGYRVGAEIGVSWGDYSRRLSRSNPDAVIYSIDPYQVYDGYEESYTQKKMEQIFKQAQENLAGTGCVLLREFSQEAAGRFDDGALDFVYIDANHEFTHVANDIKTWSAKVRVGGIVAGHDFARYKRRPLCHVKEVVGAWTYAHHISPWFVVRGSGNSSWFWVKR